MRLIILVYILIFSIYDIFWSILNTNLMHQIKYSLFYSLNERENTNIIRNFKGAIIAFYLLFY